MKPHKVITILLILGLAGCIPSLHQLWTEKTLIYDPAFVGAFEQEKERWTIAGEPEKKTYLVTIEEDDEKESKLIARLVDVQGHLFFDFYPEGELPTGDWTKFHILGVHLFYKIEKTETGFNLSMMNPDTVNDLLEEKPSLVKHEMVADGEGDDEHAVLTDKPENLQRFLLEGLKIEKFFGDPIGLKRVTVEPASEASGQESPIQ